MSLDINKILFRVVRGLERRFYRLFKIRPSSEPYLSGDSFRTKADFIYEFGNYFKPGKVFKGALIFLDVRLLDEYFAKVHPLINNPYILLTHNGDRLIDQELVKFVDEKIIHWFAQNCTARHPQISPLPIGLENRYLCYNGLTKYFKKIQKSANPKKDLMFFGFNVATNPAVRQPVLEIVSRIKIAEKLPSWPVPYDYLKKLSSYKFVISPPGNGLDCHRIWEAMYLRTVPVVERSPMTEYFKKIGLPLWLVDDWQELKNATPESLSQKYEQLASGFNSPSLKLAYWLKKIKV